MVRGLRSSSVAVAHEGYLVKSRRPLWFDPHKLIALSLYTEHSPLAAVSRSTLIISLHLASRASLSSPSSSPCWFSLFSLSALLVFSLEQLAVVNMHQHAMWKYCIVHKWGRMCIYGIHTYQTYQRVGDSLCRDGADAQ